MISSMTGFGRAQQQSGGHDITVEIKSVNHRFFEFSSRIPRAYGYLDEKLKSFLSEKVSRGKVDVSVLLQTLDGSNAQVEINYELARSYLSAVRGMGEALDLEDNVKLTDLTRFGDIFTVRKTEEDEAAIWDAVRPVAEEALEKFLAMRAKEGERLKADILSRLDLLETLTAQVEDRSPSVTDAYRERLYAKLADLLQDKQIDDGRLLTEAAIFSEKTAVAEETVRLKSHISQFCGFLSQQIPVGRKMDFLVQELNRETNTIGSKCQDLDISRIVVEMKSEIEKIREQIQNIE
ncbi:YicC family protein [Ruminococcaceae bacterium OttesenSCG-928-L11]|nr:YicC family protein [Ruminococcaceae bacterium OttesenSCG-928-L11]